jgi:hypothetical protein
MTQKKIALTIAMLIVTFVVIVSIGIAMVTSSGAYVVAQTELARYLNVPSDQSKIPYGFAWWASWSYSESASTGNAFFTMCTTAQPNNSKCYSVRLKKEFEKWKLVSLKERT